MDFKLFSSLARRKLTASQNWKTSTYIKRIWFGETWISIFRTEFAALQWQLIYILCVWVMCHLFDW